MKFILILIAFLACTVNAQEEQIDTFEFENGVSLIFNVDPINTNNCEGNQCFPNGEPVFGAIGKPNSYVKKITLKVGGSSYELESGNMYSPYTNATGHSSYINASCSGENYCLVRGVFSDGCCGYVAEWLVFNGKPIRTMLTGSRDILSLNLKKILNKEPMVKWEVYD